MIDLKNRLRNLISEGKIENAFDALRTCFPNGSENGNAVIVQQSAWKEANNKLNAGLLTFQELTVIQNQIGFILLRLIDQLPETDFEKALSELDISELGTIALVNCNRSDAYKSVENFFLTHETLPYQFYFIVGCPTQQPNSFAERLIYEVIENILIDEESAIDFLREKEDVEGVNVERVKIPALPTAMNADISQRKFRKDFGERLLRFNMGDISLESFIEEKAAQLKYKYFSFLYHTEADCWNSAITTPYVQWLVETFKKNKVHQPTFLFYFVVNMENAHVQKREDIMVEINKIKDLHPDACTIIDTFKPLKANDLNRWLRERGERSQAKIDDLVKKFSNNLSLQSKLKADGSMDMTDVEQLQGKVFAHFMKKQT